MALIKCKDCGTDVSDVAQACPKCAAPLKGIMHDGVNVTMQFTNKNLKLHRLFALLTLVLGLIIGAYSDGIGLQVISSLLIFVSMIWIVVNIIRK
ncbi:MAG: zinc ribbon domain-containing protein [Gammaproteobacteria bacterium WSBS_2016_MAG_OTU1]